jgi:GNAT superfamily N-acetyltransferase
MNIREATIDDVDAIYDMIVELAVYEKEPDAVVSTRDDLRNALFSDAKSHTGAANAYAHVAEVDGKVIGFALWFLNYSTWLGKHGLYLEDLYVKPEYRGHGAGKALMRRLAQICVERGYGRFEWWVLDWNTPSIDFYKAHGAVPMDEWTVFRLTGDALREMAAE